jgi:hypothetical protein
MTWSEAWESRSAPNMSHQPTTQQMDRCGASIPPGTSFSHLSRSDRPSTLLSPTPSWVQTAWTGTATHPPLTRSISSQETMTSTDLHITESQQGGPVMHTSNILELTQRLWPHSSKTTWIYKKNWCNAPSHPYSGRVAGELTD